MVLFVEQPLTSQRRQHTTSHINKYQHAQKHTAQTHHARNVSCMMRTCSPDREWAKAHALWPSARYCRVYREPIGRAIIVIVIEIGKGVRRERKRDEQRERKRHMRGERHEKRGRERERLPSKRSRVYVQDCRNCGKYGHKASDCWYKQTTKPQGKGKGTGKSKSKVTEISESDNSEQVEETWTSNTSAQQPNLYQVNAIGCADEGLWIFSLEEQENVGTQ